MVSIPAFWTSQFPSCGTLLLHSFLRGEGPGRSKTAEEGEVAAVRETEGRHRWDLTRGGGGDSDVEGIEGDGVQP